MPAVPGRICLVGEHCDWAGGASVVVPLDRTLTVRARAARSLSATARFEGATLDWRAGEEPGPLRFVPAAAEELGVTGARVEIDGDLPAGRGFSSSAALCVGLVRAFAELSGRSLDPDEVADLAFRIEHDRVGVACGRLDPLACAWGVPLFLRFVGDSVDLEPLPAQLSLAVGSFPSPRDTPGILAELSRHHRGDVPLRDFEAVSRVGAIRGALEGFAAQAVHAREALLQADLRALGSAMNVCQDIYEEELMPTFASLRAPGLVRAVRALRAAGAAGAKFSGAGGEGSVIGLYGPRDPRVGEGVAALDRLGLTAFAADVSCAV